VSKNHDLIEIAAQMRRETDKALLLFDGVREAWVPKALVEDNKDGTFTMPEWLAKDKELI
jgi:hypothetical protein